MIDCPRRPRESERDPKLYDKLAAEAPGILNWMLAALPGLLQAKAFDIPETIKNAVAKLKIQVSPIREFLEEKVETGNDADFIEADQLMGIFEQWCTTNGYRKATRAEVASEIRARFNVELERRRRGSKSATGRERIRLWQGLRWKSEADERDLHDTNKLLNAQNREIQHQKESNERLQKQAAEGKRPTDRRTARDELGTASRSSPRPTAAGTHPTEIADGPKPFPATGTIALRGDDDDAEGDEAVAELMARFIAEDPS